MSRPEAAAEERRDTRTPHGHRPALPDDLTRALQQAARAVRKHYSIRTRSQADRAGKLFARALFPRRAGRPRRRDVTRVSAGIRGGQFGRSGGEPTVLVMLPAHTPTPTANPKESSLQPSFFPAALDSPHRPPSRAVNRKRSSGSSLVLGVWLDMLNDQAEFIGAVDIGRYVVGHTGPSAGFEKVAQPMNPPAVAVPHQDTARGEASRLRKQEHWRKTRCYPNDGRRPREI